MRRRKYLYIKYFSKRLIQKILIEKMHFPMGKPSQIMGEEVPDLEKTNQIIGDAIKSGKPFCLLRPGNSEFSLATKWDEHLFFGTNRYKTHNMFEEIDSIDEYAQRWVDMFEKDLGEADIFACFGSDSYMEHYLIDAYANNPKIILLPKIESWWLEKPWLQELKGKKVLFISPFTDAMKRQYEKRDLIWGGKEILPDMDIKFLKSVWYMGKDDNSGFENWFAALDYLYNEATKIDFDIALIGCGPFSTFLAAAFKRDGKQAIQYGGALQLLFGIRGARWDDSEKYKPFYNEYWVRPPKEEAPKTAERLDNKIYW